MCVSLRRRRRCSSPRGNVLVERRSEIKHTCHISHLRCVPTPNVLVERRSERKHINHISHFFCVPTPIRFRPDVLGERRCAFKHITHSGHRRRVPLRYVTVECTSITKACVGISIPSTHIRHQTRIPISHRIVIVLRRPIGTLPSNRSFG